MKIVKSSFTGKLRWFQSVDEKDGIILQQEIIEEGPENGVWTKIYKWIDVEFVKQENNE